jgi:hypothetical protein
MEIQATKVYFDFLKSASFIFDELLSPNKRASHNIKELKKSFSNEAFERFSRDFIEEVENNLDQYQSPEIVWNSLCIYHDDYLAKYGKNYSNTEIHKANFEIAFMLGLLANIQRSHIALEKLLKRVLYLGKYSYPFLHELRTDKSLEYFAPFCRKVEGQIKAQEITPPNKDMRFDFFQLQKEIEQLKDPFDQMGLIKRRQADLKIWTNLHDMTSGVEEFYTRQYYPHFHTNCNIELDRIEQDLQIQLRRADFEKQKSAPLPSAPFQKLKWEKTPKEFAQTFNKLIKDNAISLKGESDTEPIVRVLSDMFEIPKRGGGLLNSDSLSTYFKKSNTGDL